MGAFRAWIKDSETILIARLTMVGGVITGAMGFMDFSPLLSLDISSGFNRAQVMWLGGITFLKGLIDEIARRVRDPDL